MKIAYSHLVNRIKENPSIDRISESLFQLGHEHEIKDDIFDMEFTPNRGDCLSLNGLLRDLAVFYTVDLKQAIYNSELDDLQMDFKNTSTVICPKISFLKLELENIPEYYNEYLNNYFLDLNLNKNNFFTDISNYLSYETGQPTHCYDASKINGRLNFHEIDSSYEFETLLDKKINITGKNSVFSINDNIINLAGVVGSKSTSCSKTTKTVLVECAYFQPEAIIGKSVKYDIQSEASHKFERGVDPMCQETVLRRFIKIVKDHAKIKNMSIISYNFNDAPINKIPLDVDKINQIIGIKLISKDYINYLSKLGFIIDNEFIEVPSYRSDVKTINDLAEEVARVIGYDNIKTSTISIPKNKKSNLKDIESKLRYFLVDNGFYEVINSPFVMNGSKNSIKVDNPLDTNRGFLRTNITDSLVDNLLYNEKRQKDSVKLFEIADIYSFHNGINKKRRISIIASGRVGLNYEDFSKKINKKYFIELFQQILPGKVLEFDAISRDSLTTKINNEIISFEVDIDIFSDDVLNYNEVYSAPLSFNQYKKISDLPSSSKDISFSVKDYNKVSELEELLLNYKNQFIKHVYIFDYFVNKKNNEIKIGFRFTFQAKENTLTAAQIEFVYNEIMIESVKIKGVRIPGFSDN